MFTVHIIQNVNKTYCKKIGMEGEKYVLFFYFRLMMNILNLGRWGSCFTPSENKGVVRKADMFFFRIVFTQRIQKSIQAKRNQSLERLKKWGKSFKIGIRGK